MTVEIERKFVPAAIPPASVLGRGEALRQGYLAEEGDVGVRIRIGEQSAVVTIKAGSGVSRTEVELTVSDEQAAALWEHTVGRRIAKTRHRVDVDDDHTAEVDVYHDALDGLCTVEVEFDSVDEANAFEPPEWFGRDVTGDQRWTNAALARHGVPDTPSAHDR